MSSVTCKYKQHASHVQSNSPCKMVQKPSFPMPDAAKYSQFNINPLPGAHLLQCTALPAAGLQMRQP